MRGELFASENEGGQSDRARHCHTCQAVVKKRGIARQTLRVNVVVSRTALAKRRLGRGELRPFSDWNDGEPETELNLKFYRQATNKVADISDEAAAFLDGFICFERVASAYRRYWNSLVLFVERSAVSKKFPRASTISLNSARRVLVRTPPAQLSKRVCRAQMTVSLLPMVLERIPVRAEMLEQHGEVGDREHFAAAARAV